MLTQASGRRVPCFLTFGNHMRTLFLTLLLGQSATFIHAADIMLHNGAVYKNARITEDTARFQMAVGSSSMSAQAQAQHTLHWFDSTLRPYVTQWRALMQ